MRAMSAIILILAALFYSGNAVSAERVTAKVSGIVFYAGTTIPISGIDVRVGDLHCTTGSSGEYTIENVTIGSALLEATGSNVVDYKKTIVVYEDPKPNNYSIEMTSISPVPALTGTVRDILGKPVDQVKVSVMRPDGTPSNLVDTTSMTGTYKIPALPQGTRPVKFEKVGFESKVAEVHLYDTDKTFDMLLRKPPTVTILSPKNESEHFTTDTVNLVAKANDDSGNILSGNSLTWESSVNGLLGHGSSIDYNGFSEGRHQISISAVEDGCGVVTRDSVDVTVKYAPTINDLVGNWVLQYGNNNSFKIKLGPKFKIFLEKEEIGTWSLKGYQLSINVNPKRSRCGGLHNYSCVGELSPAWTMEGSGTVTYKFLLQFTNNHGVTSNCTPASGNILHYTYTGQCKLTQ